MRKRTKTAVNSPHSQQDKPVLANGSRPRANGTGDLSFPAHFALRIRRNDLIPGFILAAIVFMVFGRAISMEFTTYDDDKNLTCNPFLNPPTLSSLAHLWTSSYDELFIPITHTSHALEILLFGLHPGIIHFTN